MTLLRSQGTEVSRCAFMAARFRKPLPVKNQQESSGDFLPKQTRLINQETTEAISLCVASNGDLLNEEG